MADPGGTAGPDMAGFAAAVAAATLPFHNYNLACVPYIQTFKSFLLASQQTFRITDYKFLRVRDPNGPTMGYTTYRNGNALITTNDKHYIAVVHGLAFHNHDPYGIDEALLVRKMIPFNITPPMFETMTLANVDALGSNQQD